MEELIIKKETLQEMILNKIIYEFTYTDIGNLLTNSNNFGVSRQFNCVAVVWRDKEKLRHDLQISVTLDFQLSVSLNSNNYQPDDEIPHCAEHYFIPLKTDKCIRWYLLDMIKKFNLGRKNEQ
jgi:hypothetical protein